MILFFQTLPGLITFGIDFCKITFLCGVFFLFFSRADLKPATIEDLHPAHNVYVINETKGLGYKMVKTFQVSIIKFISLRTNMGKKDRAF